MTQNMEWNDHFRDAHGDQLYSEKRLDIVVVVR